VTKIVSWKAWTGRIWVGGLVLFGVIAIYFQPFSWQEFYSQLDPAKIAAALVFITIGKVLTIWLVKQSLTVFRQGRGFLFAWYAYSVGDIAKYLPGGVWGFVGSLSVFRSSGISLAIGGRILVFETSILIVVSFLTGLGLVLAVQWPKLLLAIPLAFAAPILIMAKFEIPFKLSAEIFLGQIVAWLFFGASFTMISGEIIKSATYAAGVFNVSFAVGTLAVFAPSGIGIREIAINFLAGEASRRLVEVAVLHRAIWLVCDILVFVPIFLIKIFDRDPIAS